MNTNNNVLWAQKFGGAFPDIGFGITADGAGNTYVIGEFLNNATFGSTTVNSTGITTFITKLDSSGQFLWTQKFDGTSVNYGSFGFGIAADEVGNTYATGFFSGSVTFGNTILTSLGDADAFVTKLDSSGKVLWAQKLGGNLIDSGLGITSDGAGNTYVTGVFNANSDINNASANTGDTFITKLNSGGNILWTKNFGGTSVDSGFGITSDQVGNTYVTGFFSGTAIFGNTTLTSAGNNDAFITKLDSSGNLLWAKNLGGNLDDGGRGIIIDQASNIYFTGYFSDSANFGSTTLSSAGDADAFIVKLDNNGNTLWAKNLGGTQYDEGYDIVADGMGNIYLCGNFSGTVSFGNTTLTSAGDSDAFIAKLDANGNILSAQRFGGTLTDVMTGIATDGVGNIYATGTFDSNATFGNLTLTSAGSTDGFVLKLAEPKITLAVTPNSVTEDGTDNLTYTFTRQGQTTEPLTVNFNVSGTATVDNDYTALGAASFSATNGTVTFAAGATTATVTIDPTADTTVESDETVGLTLAEGTGYNIGTSEAVTGKITNDDTQITLALTPNSVTEDGTDNLTYTFTRQGNTTDPLTVNFNVSGDVTFNEDYTALDADSFTATNGTVTFKAGATTASVTIDPTADTKVEPDEILGLTLAAGTGYTIGTSEAVTGKITNDDITSALKATLAPNIGNIFNLEGEAKSVQFLLKSASSGVVNEIGLFQVDDDKGTIGGVAPDDPKYAQKALENSRSIFSSLGNRPNGFNDNLTSTLDLEAGIQFRLLLVQNGTLDGLRNGTVPLSQMLLSSPTSSPVADGKFDLSFQNSPGTVVQMSLGTQGLKGSGLQDKQQGEVLDLTKLTGTQTATFTVYREAAYDNLVGFYRVADVNGGIDTDNDGKADLLPGQAGYAEAAVKNRVGDINLRVGNQGTASFTGTFEGGSIFAPFLIVKGTVDPFLDNNPNNNPAIYFPYLGANSDNVDHVRMLGNNIFGFEDLSGGGDKDFNDIIVSVKFT